MRYEWPVFIDLAIRKANGCRGSKLRSVGPHDRTMPEENADVIEMRDVLICDRRDGIRLAEFGTYPIPRNGRHVE